VGHGVVSFSAGSPDQQIGPCGHAPAHLPGAFLAPLTAHRPGGGTQLRASELFETGLDRSGGLHTLDVLG
jgi:hypothetical protein